MKYFSIIIATLISSVTCVTLSEYLSGENHIEKPNPGCEIIYNGACCKKSKFWGNECQECEKSYFWDGKCQDGQVTPSELTKSTTPTAEPTYAAPPGQIKSFYPVPLSRPDKNQCRNSGLLDLDLDLSIRKAIDLNLDLDLLKKCKVWNLDLNPEFEKNNEIILDLKPSHEECKTAGLLDLNLNLPIKSLLDLNIDLNLLKACRLLNTDLDLHSGKNKKTATTYEQCKSNGLLGLSLGLSLKDLLDLGLDLDLLKKCKLLKLNLDLSSGETTGNFPTRESCKNKGLKDLNLDLNLKNLLDLDLDLSLLKPCKLLDLGLDVNMENKPQKPIEVIPTLESCKQNSLLDIDLNLNIKQLLDLNLDLDLLKKCKLLKLDLDLNSKSGKDQSGILKNKLINLNDSQAELAQVNQIGRLLAISL